MTRFNYKWVTKYNSHHSHSLELSVQLCVISRIEVMSSFSFGFRIKVHFKVSQFKVEQNSYFLNRLLSREFRSFKSVFCVHSLKLQGDTDL